MTLIIGLIMLGFLIPTWFEAASSDRGPIPIFNYLCSASAFGLVAYYMVYG